MSPPSSNPAELKDAAKRFSRGGVSHYLTLTLDEAEGLLYVGAREAVFAVATGTVELKAAVSSPGGYIGGEGGYIFGVRGCFYPTDSFYVPRSPGKPQWIRKLSASRRARTTRLGTGVLGTPRCAPPTHCHPLNGLFSPPRPTVSTMCASCRATTAPTSTPAAPTPSSPSAPTL